MNRMSSGKKYVLYSIAIIAMLAAFILIYIFSASKITTDVSKMVANAEKLYASGDFDNAYYQLQLYCQENSDDSEAWILLGDLSLEHGDTELAYAHYKKASELIGCSDTELGEADKVKSFENFSAIESIKIFPTAKYTKGMTLSFSGENLTPANTYSGKPTGNFDKLDDDENYLTTDWFTVDESKKYVYITGNINCGEWQFLDADGYYTRYVDNTIFKNFESVAFSSKSYSYAEIPSNAIKARVTYYNKSVDTNVSSDDKIFVGYGNTLTGYTQIKSQNFEIPDLSENQYIEYSDGKWVFFDGNETSNLDWEALTSANIATIAIDGELCGTVDIKVKEKNVAEANKKLQYGLKYSTQSSIANCERLGAAKGMSFDYKIDEKWNFGTGNDFDTAYPWCEMKLCNVKVDANGKEKVTLEGDKNFKTDGSNGNVMVRIPKFYTMRVVQNGNEYLWISGTKHKGYSIEPVFIDSNGNELDYVYISAYMGALKDKKIVSIADTYPAVQIEYEDVLEYSENNGDGFNELNYLLVSALQKLFVIETGTIDSSEIFAGDTYMYYQYDTKDYETSGYACEDAKETNTIRIYNNYNTTKICEGSSIAIFNGWNNYKNNDGTQREVLEIKSTDEYIDITFDGKPMNITKHKTLISNIPAKTGKTDSIEYCTGTISGTLGKQSFKYRGIENLFGSALVMLDDDAYVSDSHFYYETDDGHTHYVDYKLAQQPLDLSNYDDVNTKMCINEMGFDSDNPTIMLPTKVGNGASAYGYYGDIWMYSNNSEPRYIMYGGADDNERAAGIFQFRVAISSYDTKLGFLGGRIMYK